MKRNTPFQILTIMFVLACFVAIGSLTGCDDDESGNNTTQLDTGGKIPKDSGIGDGTKIKMDKGQFPDKKVIGKEAGQKDMFAHKDTGGKKDTGYKGSPFGCASDLDCFGQKCCPTPWGVKLCAPSCDLKP